MNDQPETESPKRGRPSKKTPELCNEIIERLSKGEPLAWICRDEHMPAVRTVSDWKADDPEFSADFARARDEGFDALAAECLEIADYSAQDTKLLNSEGTARFGPDTEWISRSKLRVETRLKLLAKWDPKRYGERTIADVTVRKAAADLSDDELAAFI